MRQAWRVGLVVAGLGAGCGAPAPADSHGTAAGVETAAPASAPISARPERADASRRAPAPSADVPSRTFRFTYAVQIPAPPAGTKRLEAWIPVPRDEAGVQTVADLQVSAPVPHEITTEPAFGNRMIHLAVDAPTSGIDVTWTATITRAEDRGQGVAPVLEAHRQATSMIPVDGPAREVAMRLNLTDSGLDDGARTKLIYKDVLDAMAYDKETPGWGKGDFARSLDVCKGNCTDFHARFIGVGRAAGIPVRFTMGIPMKAEPKGTVAGYHCWAHWFHAGSGTWQPVDISEADKVAATDPEKARWFYGHLDPDRLTLTYGHDLTLAPAQQGPPLLYFVWPHVEADGKPVEVPKDARTLTWE